MRYDAEKNTTYLSVRELCEDALQSGSIDTQHGGFSFLINRAQAGTETHKRIQEAGGALYHAEVYMKDLSEYEGFFFEVCGRADGIIDGETVTVDEIKDLPGRSFEKAPYAIHEAQVNCYAYFLCKERGLSAVNTRLTYNRSEDGKIKEITERVTFDYLSDYYKMLLSKILYRVQIAKDREVNRIPSVKTGKFPYDTLRKGQDILLKECYRDIKAGKRLFAEAPTGTGKTVSTLYPAVVALGEGKCEKIFYLTAKAAARREAFRAAEQIFEAGSRLRTVVLSSREQMCKNECAKIDPCGISRHCNPEGCPFAKDYYDKAPNAVCQLLHAHSGYSRTVIEETAVKFGICPYEFQLDLSEFCDIIICDYNYVFDPIVYLRRYFEELCGRKYVFLIDEAHNLGDRVQGMYSDEFSLNNLLAVESLFAEDEKEVLSSFADLKKAMNGFRALCKDTLSKESGTEMGYDLSHCLPKGFSESLFKLREGLEGWLRKNAKDEREPTVFTFLGKIKHFQKISEYYDSHFVTFLSVVGEERRIRLICLDASDILDTRMKNAVSSVLFSATLSPIDYFADILGGGKDAVKISLPSPFDPDRFAVVAVPTVNTRMEDREKSYKKIASLIAASVSPKCGNYIAFFPSYDYMEKVLNLFQTKYPQVETVVQVKNMSLAQKEEFLASFKDDKQMRVGFCTLGGSFSEGVDLPGNQLIGCIVIGTGLPGISNERNILRDYYDNTRERGFDYAYVFPGMNRVLQAAGRVIRREEDKGILVLIDDRYGEERQKALFPEQWANIQFAGNSFELAELLSDFWKNT